MIKLLISPYLASGDRFHTTDFLMYYVDGIDNLGRRGDAAGLQAQARILSQADRVPAIRSTRGYSLRIVDDVAVVTLHSAPAPAHAAVDQPTDPAR